MAGFPNGLEKIAHSAEIGVTVFFVISGFLITTLLLKEEKLTGTINFRLFYLRRSLRILPVVILYLAILKSGIAGDCGISKAQFLYILTFSRNFDPENNLLTSHLWSLSVEEQFYLFFPLILMAFSKHRKLIIISLISFSWISRVLSYFRPDFSYIVLNPFFAHSDAILIGVLGALQIQADPAFLNRRVFRSYLAKLLSMALIVLIIWCRFYAHIGEISIPFGNTVTAFAILFLVSSEIPPGNRTAFKILNSRILIHLGVVSYSMYIWQQIFFSGQPAIWKTFPLNMVLIYFISLISYYAWEKPFVKVGKRFSILRIPAPETA